MTGLMPPPPAPPPHPLTHAGRYYDFDGRADCRIIPKLLSDMAPRHLLLLHGSPHASAQLAAHCNQELRDFKTQVVIPSTMGGGGGAGGRTKYDGGGEGVGGHTKYNGGGWGGRL